MVVVEELLEDVHRLVDVGVAVDDHLGVGHGVPLRSELRHWSGVQR